MVTLTGWGVVPTNHLFWSSCLMCGFLFRQKRTLLRLSLEVGELLPTGPTRSGVVFWYIFRGGADSLQKKTKKRVQISCHGDVDNER